MAELVLEGAVRARASVNIALVKYWGKAPARGPWDRNLPAVPSLSLTLDGLWTETTVRLAPDAAQDSVWLDGERLDGERAGRAAHVFDAVRERADLACRFEARSVNHVPTAAGLASSASGMAALAAATCRAAGVEDVGAMSEVARLGSGSASRSLFEGWATWQGRQAAALASREHWDVRLVVAVVNAGPKAIGSRAAMERTRRTSPFYGPWVESARETFDEGVSAVLAKDLPALADAMERSTLRMHASAMGANPAVLYWKAASLAVVERVGALRGDEGVPCGWTMDAGPNVKVLTEAAHAERVAAALAGVPGVSEVKVVGPGPAPSLEIVPWEGTP